MFALTCLLFAACGVLPGAAWADQAAVKPNPHILIPDKPTPTLGLEDIKAGMKGYGLTVFAGDKIEPFAVEVLTVNFASAPGHGLVWVRCPEPRMEKSGPVQGMSGSPIYLYTDDDPTPHKLGEGGKLIGAFAFGYSFVRECLVGVQPIKYMRQIPRKPVDIDPDRRAAKAGAESLPSVVGRLHSALQGSGLTAAKLHTLSLLSPTGLPKDEPAEMVLGSAPEAHPMLLPIPVGSPQVAKLLSPLMKRGGLRPMADTNPVAVGVKPPPMVSDPDAVKLQPGASLAVPYVVGDMDMSAIGTVTDVLPDGTVLGLGHAMDAIGPVAVPMATSYVHFVVPRLETSFKQGGAINIVGSLHYDQTVGVAGSSQITHETLPLEVTVQSPNVPDRQYHYRVIDHPTMTPSILFSVAAQSLTAEQKLPERNTVHATMHLQLSNGRTLLIDNTFAGGDVNELGYGLTPALTLPTQNPYDPLRITGAKIDLKVEPEIRQATVTGARLRSSIVAPGDQAVVQVDLQPYDGKPFHRTVKVTVPENTAEGDYQLLIGSADTYLAGVSMTRPHRFQTENIDQLLDLIEFVFSLPSDRLYLMLQLQQTGLAVAGQEMPNLPASRRAVFSSQGSLDTHPYTATVEQQLAMPMVIQGQAGLTLSVRRPTSTPAPAAAAGQNN